MEKQAAENYHDIRLTAAEVVALRDFLQRCLLHGQSQVFDTVDRILLSNLLQSLDLQRDSSSGAILVNWPSVEKARQAIVEAAT